MVTRKFTGRFPAALSDLQIVNAMAESLAWQCVVVSRKATNRKHHSVVLGAASDPPHLCILIGDEVVVMKEVEAKAEEKAVSSVSAGIPKPHMSATAMDHDDFDQGEGKESFHEVVRQHCDQAVEALSNRMEARIKIFEESSLAHMKASTDQVVEDVYRQTAVHIEAVKETQASQKHDTDQIKVEIQNCKDTIDRAHGALKANVDQLASCTNDRIQKVEQQVVMQGETISSMGKNFEAKLEQVGNSILAQIAGLQSAKRTSKRQKASDGNVMLIDDDNDSSDMEHAQPGAASNPHDKQGQDGNSAGSFRGGMIARDRQAPNDPLEAIITKWFCQVSKSIGSLDQEETGRREKRDGLKDGDESDHRDSEDDMVSTLLPKLHPSSGEGQGKPGSESPGNCSGSSFLPRPGFP